VEALARDRTVLRYDPLGTGLSDRTDAEHGGLDAELVALEAVLDGTDVPRAALLGISSGACVAAALAARSPERVEALVLLGGYASGVRITTPEVRDSILAAVRAHWGLGSRLLADVFLPEATAAELEAFARFERDAASAHAAAEHLGFVYSVDVREGLPRVCGLRRWCCIAATTARSPTTSAARWPRQCPARACSHWPGASTCRGAATPRRWSQRWASSWTVVPRHFPSGGRPTIGRPYSRSASWRCSGSWRTG
jgi:pimeloyl-ACP methyl ester carboxylesterase